MKRMLLILIAMALIAVVPAGVTDAASTCTFTTVGTTMTLNADCTTDTTILVPDGYTLDGDGNTITAIDPAGGHFLGAVVKNGGAEAHVTDLTVTASGLANVCDSAGPPDNRLRGILFDGAAGTITKNVVTNVNQGASGCQEGNAIEVRNAPFDGTHPGTLQVEIAHNVVENYQKTGIVANGDVDVDIHHNTVGASATQENLAPNSIQIGFGALGSVTHNHVDGNQWKGGSGWASTAVLIYLASPGVVVSQNNIGGNSDVGVYVVGDGAAINNNRVFDYGGDHPNSDDDTGIAINGNGNVVTNNKVRGFDVPYYGLDDLGSNKVIPAK
jgi:hypothetical protein